MATDTFVAGIEIMADGESTGATRVVLCVVRDDVLVSGHQCRLPYH